jgi:hypothetical protein
MPYLQLVTFDEMLASMIADIGCNEAPPTFRYVRDFSQQDRERMADRLYERLCEFSGYSSIWNYTASIIIHRNGFNGIVLVVDADGQWGLNPYSKNDRIEAWKEAQLVV